MTRFLVVPQWQGSPAARAMHLVDGAEAIAAAEAEARDKYNRLTGLILEEDGIALIKGLTGGTLDMTLHVTRGRGYQPVTQRHNDDEGATIGQLDEISLFYLVSRGIGRRQANVLLTMAFINELVEQIPVEAVRETVQGRLNHFFEQTFQEA